MGRRLGWWRAGGRTPAAIVRRADETKTNNTHPLFLPSASNPGTVTYSPTTDNAYVGHASHAGSAVEGGAFDAAGARVSSAAPPHGGGSSLFVVLGGADAVTPGAGARAAWSGDAATVGATQAKEGQAAVATTTAAPAATTTAKSDASVDSTTLAQATTTPTTSFPTAGQHAATRGGGVSTAGGETTYLRADRAVAAAAPAALDSLPKPPAPRGPAGALAATALTAVGGAAASVSASAGAAVPQDAPPADDAEAFSMMVRDVAAGVAGRLGAAPRRAGPGV